MTLISPLKVEAPAVNFDTVVVESVVVPLTKRLVPVALSQTIEELATCMSLYIPPLVETCQVAVVVLYLRRALPAVEVAAPSPEKASK